MTPTAKTPTAMTQEACLTAPLPVASADRDSSLTGAYLNQFNEMVRLIEQLPDTPELIDDILNWHPTTYQDYFNASAMPGRVSAADVYASLNRCVRQNFEGAVDDLDRKALGAVAVIRRLQDPWRSPPRHHDGDLRARRHASARSARQGERSCQPCSRRSLQFRPAPEAAGLASLSAGNSRRFCGAKS
jgi:hypothetical protein